MNWFPNFQESQHRKSPLIIFFSRITSNEKGICEMPSINVDFADAGSLIFAGPIAISRKKTGTGSRNYLKIAKRSTIPS